MMKKINQISVLRNDVGARNDLYTRYRKQMEVLLSTNDTRPGTKKDADLYIPDKLVEEELSSVYNDRIDSLSMLIGYAGIGKSTVLRNYFKYRNSLPTLSDDRKILIFPTSFNNVIINEDKGITEEGLALDIKEDLTHRIDAVCSFLEGQFDGLKERFDSNRGQMEFYQLLEKTNPRVLEHVPYNLRMNLSKDDEKKLKLSYAYEKERFICAATKLKFYLNSPLCSCNKIIVILDDIEPLPYKNQAELVMQYVRFYDCLKNDVLYTDVQEYLVNMIISIRPHTYRILRGYKAFKAYYVTREILKRDMVDLNTLFNVKLDYYSHNIDVSNEEAWKQSRQILTRLSGKFSNKYANMIKNICLWSTRDAMKAYTTILVNRIWIQRDMAKTSGFTIRENDYVFNNITVIRALACEQYYVYARRGEYWIPNLLYNTVDKNYSFINLCICNCFEKDKNQDYTYGTDSKSFGDIVGYFMKSFPDYKGLEKSVESMIRYLYDQKILQKSINDTDKEETIGKSELLNTESLLYLTPKGYELLRMIEADSVYMELCREDYYRDYQGNEELNSESSFELMQKGQQDAIFYDLFLFLLDLLEWEDKFISYAADHHTIDIYTNCFGEDIVFERFYHGIWRSIDYSGTDKEFLQPVVKRVSDMFEIIKRKKGVLE